MIHAVINNNYIIYNYLQFLALSNDKWECSTSPVYAGALCMKSSLLHEHNCSPLTWNLTTSTGSRLNSWTAHSNHCVTCCAFHLTGSIC